MGELRFKVELCSGCTVYDAVGVMVKGDDARWRYWLEFNGRVVPGIGDYPPTRGGHARLKACARDQLGDLLWPPRRAGAPEDVQ